MAKIYLACEAKESDHAYARSDYKRMLRYSRLSTTQKHQVVSEPSEADIIVFVGSARPNYSDIRSSSLYKKYKEKSVIINCADKEIPLIPGLYACLENRWGIGKRKSISSWCYLRVAENDSLDTDIPITKAKYLFSFIGNMKNHRVREDVLKLSDLNAYLEDSSKKSSLQSDGTNGENHRRGVLYRDVMEQSQFVLCPRGFGVSSWRIFETMRAGRVPVIISDHWVPPKEPQWSEFAIFVRESEVYRIPEILSGYQHLVESFGYKARSEWERLFDKSAIFDTTIDSLLSIHQNRDTDSLFLRALIYMRYLDPFYMRSWILSPIKRKIFK